MHVCVKVFKSASAILFADGTSKTKEGLPTLCLEACFYADSQLEEIFRQLRQGDITVHDLEKIKHQFEQMNRLCIAAQKKREEAEHTSEYIWQLVELRLQELATYQCQQGYLQHLCSKIHSSVDGEQAYCVLKL